MSDMEPQLNPLVVPLQAPERFSPIGHVMLLHFLQVPGLAPDRYWLAVQTMFGMVVQVKPLDVSPQAPERFSPVGHVIRSHA